MPAVLFQCLEYRLDGINILKPMDDAGLTKTITADDGLHFASHETL